MLVKWGGSCYANLRAPNLPQHGLSWPSTPCRNQLHPGPWAPPPRSIPTSDSIYSNSWIHVVYCWHFVKNQQTEIHVPPIDVLRNRKYQFYREKYSWNIIVNRMSTNLELFKLILFFAREQYLMNVNFYGVYSFDLIQAWLLLWKQPLCVRQKTNHALFGNTPKSSLTQRRHCITTNVYTNTFALGSLLLQHG